MNKQKASKIRTQIKDGYDLPLKERPVYFQQIDLYLSVELLLELSQISDKLESIYQAIGDFEGTASEDNEHT